MSRTLLTVSFVIGSVVGNALTFRYWLRSRWRSSVTGRVLLSLFAVTALSYDLSALALLWPDFFIANPVGVWIRVGLRFAIDAALIGMYVLLVQAQRRDRASRPEGTVSDQPR